MNEIKDREPEIDSDDTPALTSDVQEDTEKLFPENKIDAGYIVKSTVLGLVFVLGIALFSLSVWYKDTYSMSFRDLLYIITGPVAGTGQGMVKDIVMAIVPSAFFALGIYLLLLVVIKKNGIKWLKNTVCIICSLTLPISALYTVYAFDMLAYYVSQEETGFYQEYYVHPNSVSITAGEEKRNLIYIYIESLENTHITVENGGVMTENYLPKLSELAKDNVSFSHLEEGKLGGFRETTGSGWTIAALLATTSGIPYSFPIDANSMHTREWFAPGLTNLGDILEEQGYNQEFVCGSDKAFAGRDKFFTQHGNYKIMDLFAAREAGYIPEDYSVWWGYEDKRLFDIAKTEVTQLAGEGKPFNMTVLTVDLHSTNGYVCEYCTDEFPEITANVLRCTDRLVTEFVEWCQTQPFYEDTTIIVTGDHRRHDKNMIKEVEEYDRTIYNCFINSAVQPKGDVNNRQWTSYDMFPTILSSMGFEIEGNRLGLGTDMFSGDKTLCEELGYEKLNEELGKQSEYYLMNFYYTLDELLELKKEENTVK